GSEVRASAAALSAVASAYHEPGWPAGGLTTVTPSGTIFLPLGRRRWAWTLSKGTSAPYGRRGTTAGGDAWRDRPDARAREGANGRSGGRRCPIFRSGSEPVVTARVTRRRVSASAPQRGVVQAPEHKDRDRPDCHHGPEGPPPAVAAGDERGQNDHDRESRS